MYLGKAIRLGRLFDDRSGRLLAITLDHAIARGVLPGLVDVGSAVASQDRATEPYVGQVGVKASISETGSVRAGGLGK